MEVVRQNSFDFSKYINYCIIILAFMIPVSKAGITFFESLIFILFLLEGNFKEKWLLFLKSKVMITLFVFICFSIIILLSHEFSKEVLTYLSKYKHFILAIIIFLSVDKKYIKNVFSAFILGILFSELVSYGIFFELIHYKNISPHDPSPFMSHMTYSVFLAFSAMYILVHVIYSKNYYEKIFYSLFFLTITTNLFINGGRTGQVIYFVIVIILFFMLFKNKLKAIIFSIFIGIITLSLAFNFSNNFQNRFYQFENDIENMIYHHNYQGSFGSRVSLWILGVTEIKDNLLFGTGLKHNLKDIEHYINNNQNLKGTSHLVNFRDHHNIFVTNTLHLGIIGFIILLFLFYSQLKLKFSTPEYAALNIVFIFSFILFSFTHNTFHTTNPMLFFALFIALFSKISYYESTEKILKAVR